jgi:uncharacterized membrane protein YjgN (DUF898 family)
MPGVLALLLVIVVVFLIFFSENLQKKKMEEQLNTIIGNQKVLYGSMANLTVGTGFVRGYFAITERYLYFIESKKDGTIKLTIQLKFEEILSHKLHFVLFIEGPDHSVYEIKAVNNTQAYNVLVNQIKKVVPQ